MRSRTDDLRRPRSAESMPLGVRIGRCFVDVLVTGLAAEMAYYALLSLVPLLVALGVGLGLIAGLLGPERVRAIEDALIGFLAFSRLARHWS